MREEALQNVFNDDNHTSYELLKDWKAGLLSEETGQQIELHLKSCDRCSNVFEGLLIIQTQAETNGGETDAHQEYLDDVREKQKEMLDSFGRHQENTKRIFSWRSVISIAASIMVLGLLTYVFLPDSENSQEMVQAFLEEGYRSPVIDRASDGNSNLTKAQEFFVSGDYENAIPYFEMDISSSERNFRTEFYTGICYLMLDTPDSDKAIEYLSPIAESQSRYKEQSRWFLSLAYYLNEDQQKARALLLEITSKESHFKKDQAEKLLELM